MVFASGATKIIDIRSLYSQSKRFNLSKKLVKDAARRSGGRALGLIHPFHCKPYISSPEKISDNYFIQSNISQLRYSSYVNRVKNYIRKSLEPIFVFVPQEERQGIEAWVNSLGIDGPAVFLNTEKGDPTPKFDEEISGDSAWQVLICLLKESGISSLKLSGEIAFVEGFDKIGCVHDAFTELSPLIFVEIISELTYPNLAVFRHSSK